MSDLTEATGTPFLSLNGDITMKKYQFIGQFAPDFARPDDTSYEDCSACKRKYADKGDEYCRSMPVSFDFVGYRMQGKDFLALMVDAMPIGIALLQPRSGSIVYLNSTAANLLQLPKNGAQYMRYYKFILNFKDVGILKNRLAIADSLDGIEMELRDFFGTPFFAQIWLKKLNFRGEAFLMAGAININQKNYPDFFHESVRRKLEAKLNSLRRDQAALVEGAKSGVLCRVMSEIAHEINTPVGIGVTGTSLIQYRVHEFRRTMENASLSSDEVFKFISSIEETASIMASNMSRAAMMVESFKRMALGRSDSGIRDCRLRSMIETALRLVESDFLRRRIRVEVQCDPHLALESRYWVIIEVMTHLLRNISTHAYKQYLFGRVKIAVNSGDNGETVVSFEDNGIGIDQKLLKKIFDPFFSTVTGGRSSGIGLTIARNLTENILGGKILIASHPGRGTTVRLILPNQISEKKGGYKQYKASCPSLCDDPIL
jgi:signal transduction histidine kinase